MAEKINFAKVYQELEKINEWFQQEEIDLDEALEKFKRGLELIKICKKRLKETENQFKEIQKEYLENE
jgi:exodeoxyribonuclease VII small subunit